MKSLSGTVISTKLKKTATVLVENLWQHPLYKKTIKRTKKYLVHDEIGVKEGQVVEIIPSRPMSKKKHWKVSKIITK